MRLFKITNGFDQMTDAYLIVRAATIKSGVIAHADYFPDPTPTMGELGGTLTAFTLAVEKAEGGDRQLIAVKNAIRQTLIDQLHLLGNFVLFKAGGNEVIATASNFNISREAQPQPPITNPEGMMVRAGLNRGELELSCKRVKGARSYLYEISETPLTGESQWKTTAGTSVKFLFSGLESGKEYACRMAAIGPRQQTVYSDVVTRIAV